MGIFLREGEVGIVAQGGENASVLRLLGVRRGCEDTIDFFTHALVREAHEFDVSCLVGQGHKEVMDSS